MRKKGINTKKKNFIHVDFNWSLESTTPPCHIMTDSNEVGTEDEGAIARAMISPMFKKLSDNGTIKYGTMHFKKVVGDDGVVEKKLIARICIGSENSKKQALKKKQSGEDKKK